MPGGTGLLNFQNQYPTRTFDVGIAEEHAISMAGGLAKQGMIPVTALYSTFLQRGYDQILQDIALLQLHVVLAIDRAGLVGDDGPTHHGVFDVGFLRQVPGMKILAPVSLAEQQNMLRWAVEQYHGPVAIRYPRGTEGSYTASDWKGADSGIAVHRRGDDLTFVTYGSMLDNTIAAAERLAEQGVEATVLRLMNLTDLHTAQICQNMSANKTLIVVEETCTGSGIRDTLAYELQRCCPSCRVYGRDLGSDFVTHGNKKKLYENCGLSPQALAAYAKEVG
jgi:1-deoxy-D-xylulose-5-phosphate synthase